MLAEAAAAAAQEGNKDEASDFRGEVHLATRQPRGRVPTPNPFAAYGLQAKPWRYLRCPCLGFLPGLVCPHHDKEIAAPLHHDSP